MKPPTEPIPPDRVPDVLRAAKHPPEYRLHKYWARKPHNVVAAFLRALVPPGGRVLDPFCGSGVILAEARALGLPATGIDINPAAALIASVTANPPDPAAFHAAAAAFLGAARPALADAYRLPDGAAVRYCVHSMIVVCPDRGARVSAWAIRAQGRRRRCPTCAAKLRFNLATLAATEIVEVVTQDGTRHHDPAILAQQQAAAYQAADHPTDPRDRLLPNKRILAWDGLHPADLFTPRNRCAALMLRDHLPPPEAPAGPAVRAMLTAALAGFSRLIAYREGLRGGGPAWSVPGFWAAPVHIEHAPLPLLESWARRYRRGIPRLHQRLDGQPAARILTGPAQDRLADLAAVGERFDLVFLDPPYGDSVPYLEFSALWNAYLRQRPDYGQEVVVSNRTAARTGWTAYEDRLAAVVGDAVRVLTPGGSVLVTFNNLDGRAWGALLGALHGAGLRCTEVHYVAPAVISAKAQFAPDGSYQGDFWCVFQRGSLPSLDRAAWRDTLRAALPPDVTDPQRRRRLALRALLVHNLPPEALALVDAISSGEEQR